MSERVEVEPVIVSCAVRYALGRMSYLPGLVADEVRSVWPKLGTQQQVIRENIEEYLKRPRRQIPYLSDHHDRLVWSGLLAWIDSQEEATP
jgi:hypothetical protein